MSRSRGVSSWKDPYEPSRRLDEARAELASALAGGASKRAINGIRLDITSWRQIITVSVATARAAAGDQTAARRLAWRKGVLAFREEADWRLSRFKVWDAEMRKLSRKGIADCPCPGCSAQVARVRALRDEFLAEIAALPQHQNAPSPYRDYARRQSARVAADEAWLRHQLAGLGADA